ncbi:MAG: efflux transporter outer membrane subunit [Rubrivivax sp.]|nr:efflux transporter outer membrane subunit [Rubrivivax sp.]
MKQPALLIALAAVLGGCALTPAYERPPAPVGTQFPAPAASSGTAAPALAWRSFVTDARAQALVELALKNNRDLHVALLNVEQARAALGVQQADRLPNIGVGVAASRNSVDSSYSAGLQLSSFELDLFGRVKSLGDAAAARVLASDEGRRAVELSLIAAVVDAELALRADDELLAVTGKVLASREGSLKLVRIKFDGGAAGEPELRATESLVAGARATALALERQRAQHLNALVLLVGSPLPADLPAPRVLAQHRFADLPAGLPSDVLLQRPDVRQAEQSLIAANANIGAARAAFFPRISLTASTGAASNQLSGLFDNFAWSFAPQLLQPLFDAGRNQANLASAQAGRDIAVAQYEKAIQSAFREVADVLAARATLGAQLQAQRAQADAESRRLAVVERLLAGGAASLLDRLDAERSALAARQAVVQLELAERQNALLLYRVLGGGTAVPG